MKNLPRYRMCFVCGRDNAAGLDLVFHRSGDVIAADFTGDQRHVGFPGKIHGGILSCMLDEAMWWAAVCTGKKMVQTGELNVRYYRALPPGQSVRVEARLEEDKKRYIEVSGRIVDDKGNMYARGSGKYFRLPDEEENVVLRHMYVEGDEERVVTPDDY